MKIALAALAAVVALGVLLLARGMSLWPLPAALIAQGLFFGGAVLLLDRWTWRFAEQEISQAAPTDWGTYLKALRRRPWVRK